jgi:predicted peptidase
MSRCPILPGLLGLLCAAAGCQSPDPARRVNPLMPPGTGFLLRELQDEDGRRHRYSVFIPSSYDGSRPHPAIVFLHGHGETGSDGVRPRTVGLGPAIAERQATFDFIAIFPQVEGNWKGRRAERRALQVLENVKRDYRVDPDRIVLTGLSTGGEGTWLIGGRNAELFSALVPMCGYAAFEAVPHLGNLPIWAFHNARDVLVPVRGTRDMVRQIAAIGGNVRYTEYPDLYHNCWGRAYREEELYSWMKSQRRAPRGLASPAGGAGVR